MYRIKFVIVLLCLVNLAQSRPKKYYYPNPNDPTAIVFEGLTNYETRKSSENEVELDEDMLGVLINPRLGEIGGKVEAATPPTPPPAPVDTGFYFPDD